MKIIDIANNLKKDFDYFRYQKNDENDYSVFGFKNSVAFFVSKCNQKEIDELIEEGFFDEVQS